MINQENNTRFQDKKPIAYVNYSIRAHNVLVIESGCQPRVMQTTDAIDYAKSLNLDLVQISFDKQKHMPICKIQDYGKFKYEQQKKEKAQKKAARAAKAEVKEVCFSIRIDANDMNTKINHIKEFLNAEHAKVKINIKLLRREMHLIGMAKDLMKQILSNFDQIAELDSNPSMNGGIMSCTIRPKK